MNADQTVLILVHIGYNLGYQNLILLLHLREYLMNGLTKCNSPPIHNDPSVIAMAFICFPKHLHSILGNIRNMLLKFARKAYL